MNDCASSLSHLEERLASIPRALDEAVRVPLPRAASPKTVVVTGIGASEGPARLLAQTLAEGGIAARFVPLASFHVRPVTADLLVCFSQNLSPNARLAFGERHAFAQRWLVTSVGLVEGASPREPVLEALVRRGVSPVIVPPAREDGMLVRVTGPAVAALVALRIAAALGAEGARELDFTQASAAYACPRRPTALLTQDFALVAAGVSVESLHGHRWKLLETLLRGDPSVWDALQIAHGPLQGFYEREMRLLAFATEDASPLLDRLERTLDPSRHVLERIVGKRRDALVYFEHLCALDACVLATLRASPRDLFHWPGEGIDAPLYDLGED